jgi:hypothetical protein
LEVRLRLKQTALAILLGLGAGFLLSLYWMRDTEVKDARGEVARAARELATRMASSPLASALELDVMLAEALRTSRRPIAWIQVREGNNQLVAQAGIEERPAFTLQYVKARHASRKAAVKILRRSEGRVMVEAFPVRLGSASGSVRIQKAGLKKSSAVANAVLEIAVYLDARK